MMVGPITILRILVLFVAITMTSAKCVVNYKHGGELNLLRSRPAAIKYFPGMEVLECHKPGSCEELTITGCSVVVCSSNTTCQAARLVDNEEVICSSTHACMDSRIENGHSLICDGKYNKMPCMNGAFESDAIVTCDGPGSCSAVRNSRVTFRLGENGVIRCSNDINDSFACHNMWVEVSHASRGCFDYENESPPVCAIYCASKSACNEREIHFEAESGGS